MKTPMRMRHVTGTIVGCLAALAALEADSGTSRALVGAHQVLLSPRQIRPNLPQRLTGAGVTATESYVTTLPISTTGSLTVSNASGNVVIVGGGTIARIDAVKRAIGSDDNDARRKVQAIEVEVTLSGGNIVVGTTVPESGEASGAVDFTITVPSTVAVSTRAFLGDVRIRDINGEVAASTVSGHLLVAGLGDLRHASTISGDIEVRNSRGRRVTAAALTGSVFVRGLATTSLDVTVENGSVSCADVQADRAYLRTDRGDLDYAGPLVSGGLYQLQSRSGHVRFTPLGNLGFTLDASSFRGHTESQFPFPPDASTPGRLGLTQAIRGSVGDARASVTLRSLTGNVTVNRP